MQSRVLQIRETVRHSDSYLQQNISLASSGNPSSSAGAELPIAAARAKTATPSIAAARPGSATVSTECAAIKRCGVTTATLVDTTPASFTEADLTWFESRFFYATKMSPFFSSATQILARTKTFHGQYASQTQDLKDSVAKGQSPKWMNIFHATLLAKVSPIGFIPVATVLEFFRSLVPPTQISSFNEHLVQWMTVECETSTADDALVAYFDLSTAVEDLIKAKDKTNPDDMIVLKRCFQLCDPMSSGYILKTTLRALREVEADVPGDFNYLIAQALWRVFGKVKTLEDEKRATNTKGKGKKGKGGKGAPTIGLMRQFHLNFQEFVEAMEDSYVATAFIPYMMKTASMSRKSHPSEHPPQSPGLKAAVTNSSF